MALQMEGMQFRLPGGLVRPRRQEETDDLGDTWTVVYCESVAEIPLRFSLLAGDLVHNLRSALDYLAYQLVRLDNGKPGRRTAWPIFGEKPVGRSLSRYNAMVKGIKNEDALVMIDWFQPHKKPANLLRENLELLAELDNIDKHRLVRPAVTLLTDLRIGQEAIVVPGEVKAGNELFRIRGKMRPMGTLYKYELAFWEQQVSTEKLNGLIQTVRGVVDKVAVFFGPNS
jgi:hypothetical protein